MAERRSKSDLAAAVLAACSRPMSEREIGEAIKSAGASEPPLIDGILAALVAAGNLRRAGVRHTLDGGLEPLFGRAGFTTIHVL